MIDFPLNQPSQLFQLKLSIEKLPTFDKSKEGLIILLEKTSYLDVCQDVFG